MKRLAVIPSDLIEEYFKKGHYEQWVRNYYNPCRFFDEVYLLSPFEKDRREWLGMRVVHTPVKELKKRIKDLKIDIVRAYGGNWASRWACRNKVNGVPVIVSVHDRRPERIYDAIKDADIVLCVSPVVKEAVTPKFKKQDRAWILPDRVDFEVMHPLPQTGQRGWGEKFPFKYKILFVGRKSREKNLDTLIKALKFLGKDYGVIAVGLGEKGPYQEIMMAEGVEQQCYFIDSVPNQELPQYYSWCDCMCTPSRDEGFGIVFIEALACGAVVVTSDIRPMNEYIVDSENGLLVKEYENPQSLGTVLKRACTDENLRANLKKNARKSVECFEAGKIDGLEAGYYQKVLEMKENKSFDPRVTIVFPTFNGSTYIRQAIESCLNQTYRHIELIVIDDGSTDNTVEIINSFQDDRLRLIRFEKNRGHIAALNHGFSVSTGDFLAWASDDDYFDPDAITQMVSELNRHPDIDFVYTKYQVIDKNGNYLRVGRTEDPDYLDKDNCIGPCRLWRRKVYEAVGDFNQEAFLVEDYEYWLRVREKFRMKKMDTILFYYRLHEKSLTGVHGEEKVQEALQGVQERFIKPWKSHYFRAARLYEKQDRLAEARSEILLSLKGNLFYLPAWRLWALTSWPDGLVQKIRRLKRSWGA